MEINDIIENVKSKKISVTEGASMLSRLGYSVKDFQTENDLNTFNFIELNSKIQQELASMIGNILQIKQDQIDFNDSFMDLGLDSVNMVELTDIISNKFNISLYPTLLFEEQNISDLSHYLVKNESDVFIKYFGMDSKLEFPDLEVNDTKKDIDHKIRLNELSDDSLLEIETISKNDRIKSDEDEISIIGMSAILPEAPSLEIFWNNILNEKNSISYPEKNRREGLLFGWNEKVEEIPKAGFVANIYDFDPLFFKISPTEAKFLDPQQKLLLKAVWSAFENAGYDIKNLYTQKVGVFVGSSTNDFFDLMSSKKEEINAYYATGGSTSILANRISYIYDFRGPSEVIDAACASSLAALNRAVLALKNKECKIAVVAGVNALLTGRLFNSFQKAGMLSKEWQCKTFDESADGYVRGEGVGCIILKRKTDAVRDADPIYANVKNSVVRHGGKSNSLTAPNVHSQVDLYKNAYQNKGIDISKLGYIETHGTGTQLGDSVELNALAKFINEQDDKNNIKIILGSVKTNIGHLESASGIAGIIKTCLILSEGIIPKNLNFKKINPLINLQNDKIDIANQTQEWKEYFKYDNKNLAGVSSFGFGGTISHVVLEKDISFTPHAHEKSQNNQQIILLSSNSLENIKTNAYFLRKYIEQKVNSISIGDIAYTLQKGRSHLNSRIAFIVSNIQELIEYLKDIENGVFKNIKAHTIENKKIKNKMFDNSQNSINFCRSLLEQNKSELLINQWLIGESVPFSELYSKENRKRVHLPSNTFTQKNTQQENEKAKNLEINETKDFTINISKISENSFITDIAYKDKIVQHHSVKGKLVLPGSAYIEILLQILQNIDKINSIYIKEIRWLNPLVFNEENHKLYFDLNKNRFKFYTKEKNIEKIHVVGEIEQEHIQNLLTEKKYSINEIKNKLKEIYSGNIYSYLSSLGLSYGNKFQLVENLALNNNGNSILAELKQKNELSSNPFIIDPFLLDASFHGISLLINITDQSKVPVPYFIQNLRIIKIGVPVTYVYIRKKTNDSKDYLCEMILLNKDGEIISIIDTIKLELIKI